MFSFFEKILKQYFMKEDKLEENNLNNTLSIMIKYP